MNETLQYARTMIEHGRYDVAKRTLDPIREEPDAQALLQEVEALIAAQGRNPNAQRLTVADSLDVCVNRVMAVQAEPEWIAPRWQRRYRVETSRHSTDRVVMRVYSRAKSPLEFRYLPARALLTLTTVDEERTHVVLQANANRTYFVVGVISTLFLIFLSLLTVTQNNLSAACVVMFPVTFMTFYLVPTMMEHANRVYRDVMDDVRDALTTDDAALRISPPSTPTPLVLAGSLDSVQQRLAGLHQHATLDAADWPTQLGVTSARDGDGLRFRVQANPLLFYNWAWMPPTVVGDMVADGDGVRVTLTPAKRNDLLVVWLAVVLMAVVVATLISAAIVPVQIVVIALAIVGVGYTYAIAQPSMDYRGAQLASYLAERLLTAPDTAA